MRTTRIVAIGALLLLLCSCVAPESPTPAATPPPPPAPTPPRQENPDGEERNEKMDLIATLTLEEKIGQLIFAGYQPGDPAHLSELILEHKVGGIILFRRNITDLTGVVAVTAELHELNMNNPLPLFIGIDEEGGTVSRLPAGAMKLPDARVLGGINDPDLTYWAALALAQELRALGISVNFAPVLDVYLPGSDFLYHRSFGTDPDVVALHGTAFAAGLKQGKVLAVGKHFPGHGGTPVDSHRTLPVIRDDLSTISLRELVPFRAVIAADIPALMVGHLAFPALDEMGLPATRSREIMSGLLRDDLDFDGLIFSDDLEMGAYLDGSSWEISVVESIKAGCDILIIAHSLDRQEKAIKALRDAVLSGDLPMEQLDSAVKRIIRAKQELDLTHQSLPAEEAMGLIGREQTISVQREIERRR